MDRVVAIKVMAPQLAANSMAVKRFLREARAAVSHDHVVTIHGIEEDKRPPYIVMEFIDGPSLQEKIDAEGALELKQILRIGVQVARGLAAAHGQGLVHRDIKPANILLENRLERVKLTDFGLARAVDDAGMTKTGEVSGTPQYMSPEQAEGGHVDRRSDLFSLGCVMYAVCTGQPPFRAETTMAILKRICEDTPRPIREINPDIPDWLETIIFKLLQKDPDDRYQMAQEVADLLARCLRELEHNGKVRCVETSPGSVVTQVFRPQTPTGSGSKKKPLGWLAGGVIAVAAVIGIALMKREKETPAPVATRSPGNTTSPSTIQIPATPKAARGWHGWPADAPPPAIAPFNAEQAKGHQEAWAKYLGVPVEYENSIGMKLRLIPPGEFTMAATAEEIEAALKLASAPHWRKWLRSEAPQHKVILTRPIYVGVTEVTQAQYERVMGTNRRTSRPQAKASRRSPTWILATTLSRT